MSILETLKQIKDGGFDPKTSKINKGGLLEPGTYAVRLISSDFNVTTWGQEQATVTLEVVSGENAKRKELINLTFGSDLPPFVLEKNGKILLKLAEFTGVTLTQKDIEDEMSVADALKRGIGKQLEMKLTTAPNKKNPDYPYRNYEFAALEDAPISEEQLDGLPF